MRLPVIVAFAFLLILSLNACGDAPGGEAGASAESMAATDVVEGPCPSLIGSWELVSIAETAAALSGEFESDPDYQQAPTLKILNGSHWMFIRQSADEFVHSQGGRYSLEPGGFYTEYVEYSAIPENVGQSFAFECVLEGDSLWHHRGGQGDTRYDEVWRRVR